MAEVSEERLQALYADIPFGLPEEQTAKAKKLWGVSRSFSVDGYGFDTWRKLFTNRQLLALWDAALIRNLRGIPRCKTRDWPDGFTRGGDCDISLLCQRPAAARLLQLDSAPGTTAGRRSGIHLFNRFALPMKSGTLPKSIRYRKLPETIRESHA